MLRYTTVKLPVFAALTFSLSISTQPRPHSPSVSAEGGIIGASDGRDVSMSVKSFIIKYFVLYLYTLKLLQTLVNKVSRH